jgi:hypothetical protein
MRREFGLCLLMLSPACGDDSKSPQERLQGNWISESNDTECATILTVQDDLIELKLACELDDGTHALEVHSGTFEATDGDFTWTFKKSTCADSDLRPDSPQTLRYSFVGKNLRVISDDGVIQFEEVSEPSGNTGSGQVEFGCFDEDDAFEPSPLKPI